MCLLLFALIAIKVLIAMAIILIINVNYPQLSIIAINALFAIVINMLSSNCKQNVMQYLVSLTAALSQPAGCVGSIFRSPKPMSAGWITNHF